MNTYDNTTAPGEKSESLPERAIVEAGAELMEQTLKAVLRQLPTQHSRMAFVLMITTFMLEACDGMRKIVTPSMPYEVMLSQLTGTEITVDETDEEEGLEDEA